MSVAWRRTPTRAARTVRFAAKAMLCTLFTTVACAAAFDDGLAAFVRADYATAIRHWEPLAEAGNADAQYNLGSMYENGQGAARDYTAAVRFYRRAAAQGHPDAQYNLAKLYESGNGVTQDSVRAYVWFAVSANISLNGMLWSGIAALTSRDVLAARLPPDQLVVARALVRRCEDTNFTACGD